MSALTIALVAASLFCRAPVAFAQAEAPAPSAEKPAAATPGAAKLAQDFNDPLTTLPQLSLQDAYTPTNYGTHAQTNQVTARLIVPRIPKFSLLPFVQLIRPSLSLVTVPEGKGRATRTELGDMGLFDLAVLPWPGEGSGLLMGVGPVFVFPTATYKTAGLGAWQVGPAFGAIYKGIPGVLLGGLLQNPISFAYTSSDRRPLSTLLVQPILLKQLWRGLYVKSADATWTFGERAGSAILLPLSLGLGYVIPREGAPPINVSVSGAWMAYRQNAPVASQTTVRLAMTIAFPEWTRWQGF
jgi:hypothetical protein